MHGANTIAQNTPPPEKPLISPTIASPTTGVVEDVPSVSYNETGRFEKCCEKVPICFIYNVGGTLWFGEGSAGWRCSVLVFSGVRGGAPGEIF